MLNGQITDIYDFNYEKDKWYLWIYLNAMHRWNNYWYLKPTKTKINIQDIILWK